MITALERLDISRPIYFLCGPKIHANSKRMVLHNFLIENFRNQSVRPFPIIVDDIFNSPLIKKYSLDIGLLEEIVSSISHKTYIFLDSLSTAFEYGSFQNSKTQNSVVVLLEKTFKQRKRRQIGEYIENRFDKSTVITYDSKLVNAEKEYYEFIDNKVPKNISKHINDEMESYAQNVDFISFFNEKSSSRVLDINTTIRIKIDNSKIETRFSIKSLFYLMSYYFLKTRNTIKEIRAKNNKSFEKEYKSIIKSMFGYCLGSAGNNLERCGLYTQFDLFIDGYNKQQVKKIIRHVYFFFVLINKLNKKQLYKLTNVEDCTYTRKIEKYDLSDIFDSLNRNYVLEDYITHPDDYVDSMRYKIKNKVRTIYKYKDNYKGEQLKSLHKVILKSLNRVLPSNDCSYAYKENRNTLQCINRHSGSTKFLKLDVKNYFGSIRYRRFLSLLNKQIRKNLSENGISSFGKTIPPTLNSKFIRTLFYKNKLPLGFIASPKVSDFYLFKFDNYLSQQKDIIYTRYADDLLASTKEQHYNFSYLENRIKSYLKRFKLEIKEEKSKIVDLSNPKLYLKFLGIVAIKQNYKILFKISNSYLKEIIKETKQLIKNKKKANYIIAGKVRYIRSISKDSYKKYMISLVKIDNYRPFYCSLIDQLNSSNI